MKVKTQLLALQSTLKSLPHPIDPHPTTPTNYLIAFASTPYKNPTCYKFK